MLAYHIQKPSSIRRRLSRFGDNNFIRRLRRSLSMRNSRAHLQPKEDPEIAAQEQQTDYHEDDKRFRREEFEENLLEMGLELEKDEAVRRGGSSHRRKTLALNVVPCLDNLPFAPRQASPHHLIIYAADMKIKKHHCSCIAV